MFLGKCHGALTRKSRKSPENTLTTHIPLTKGVAFTPLIKVEVVGGGG